MSTSALLRCGAWAGPFFVVTFLIEGATLADYSALRHPVSLLALGDLGWIQVLNFFISGVLMLAFAIGLRRALRPAFWGSFLIGLLGVSSVAAGMFTSDPINGYPPGTPLLPMQTTEGMLHGLSGLPVILAWPIACVLVGRRFWKLGQRGWAIYSVVNAIAMVVTAGLAGLGLSQTNLALSEVAGAFQRLSLILGFAWTAFVARHLMRSLFMNSSREAARVSGGGN